MKALHLLTLLLSAAAPAPVPAQGGSLTPPPGAPAPTMKSLDIVEARTPLVAGAPGVTVDGTTGAITITAPGSYYLTKNLTNTGTLPCIHVGTHTASIDLNGFTISSTTNGPVGIQITGAAGQNVVLKNGIIRGSGRSSGLSAAINVASPVAGNVHVAEIQCADVQSGIVLSNGSGRHTVRNCSVENSGGIGIRAEIVSDCVVKDTVGDAIQATNVTNCVVRQTDPVFAGRGIYCVPGFTDGIVSNCRVEANGLGIKAVLVKDCHVRSGGMAVEATVATGCVVEGGVFGTSFSTRTAIGCVVLSGNSTITNKYNMP